MSFLPMSLVVPPNEPDTLCTHKTRRLKDTMSHRRTSLPGPTQVLTWHPSPAAADPGTRGRCPPGPRLMRWRSAYPGRPPKLVRHIVGFGQSFLCQFLDVHCQRFQKKGPFGFKCSPSRAARRRADCGPPSTYYARGAHPAPGPAEPRSPGQGTSPALPHAT